MNYSIEYIKENKDLISTKQYQKFLEDCPESIHTEVVNMLLAANINFLPYMQDIPEILFANDVNLPETLILPNNIKKINGLAFYENDNIKHIEIPGSVKVIEYNAFAHCENLETLEIKDGVQALGPNIIEGTSKLKSLTIPASVTEIDEGCFCNSSIMSINFKGKFQSFMRRFTFEACHNLLSIMLPEGLKDILPDSFTDCYKLEIIHFPSTIEYISATSFSNCSNIKTIYYDGTKEDWGNKVNCRSPEINKINITFLK